jgi:CubicO group peptidase (beta-lactamase class C family)
MWRPPSGRDSERAPYAVRLSAPGAPPVILSHSTPIATPPFVLALSLLASPTAALFAQTHARTIDSLMAVYAAPDGPGASVLVVRDGRTVFTRGYGRADIERGVAVTPATNFRLASLSKQFTAAAVMLLFADRRLRYDDDITTLVPGLPEYARGVTVRQLLTHTSGLPDYEDFVPDSQTAQVHDADIPALIGHATGAKFPAGSRYAYSNTGYGLLSLIVERASGMRYARFLHERIFAPLHMTGTVAHEEGRSTVPHRAYGYTLDGAVPRRTDQSNTSAVLGDGGIYSSAADLAKWIAAQERHTLIGAGAQRLAWTPPSLPAGARTEYGFGWFVDHDMGTLRLRHHGESRGFTNGIVSLPERRLAVVVLTNRTGGAPWDIAQRIAELYLDPSTVTRSPDWHPR